MNVIFTKIAIPVAFRIYNTKKIVNSITIKSTILFSLSNLNEKGWVNFPDWQMRLYRNCDWVKWDGLLHSKVEGHKSYVFLPTEELFCIIHQKQLARQVEQNNLYDKIEQTGRTKYKV